MVDKSKMAAELIVGGASKSHKRVSSDYYPTPPECIISLFDWLVENGLIIEGMNVWEPACGQGHISKILKRYGLNVTSTDLFKRSKPSYILPMSWRPNFCPERGKSPPMEAMWTVWVAGNNKLPKFDILVKP